MGRGTIDAAKPHLPGSHVLLTRFAEYLKTKRGDADFHVVRQSGGGEELSLPADEPELRSAAVVEGDALAARSVGRPAAPRFTHFLDGIERTHVPCYRGMIPILYAFTGAAIRQRKGTRRMSTCAALSGENLYFPFSHMEPSELLKHGVTARDTDQDGARTEPAEVHPIRLLELARRAVSKDREKLERELAERWLREFASGDAWLLVDGSLTGGFETYKHPRMVGAIKSHQTQYFPAQEQAKILGLQVGERSSVFKPIGRERTPVFSWYLRLHANAGRDVYFGLVRVEAAAADETIAMADEISRWLLGERAPLSLPDGRWDRLLYPIRDCEQYLRSIAPSRVVIEAALAGL